MSPQTKLHQQQPEMTLTKILFELYYRLLGQHLRFVQDLVQSILRRADSEDESALSATVLSTETESLITTALEPIDEHQMNGLITGTHTIVEDDTTHRVLDKSAPPSPTRDSPQIHAHVVRAFNVVGLASKSPAIHAPSPELAPFSLRLRSRVAPSTPRLDPGVIRVPRGHEPTTTSSRQRMFMQRAFFKADKSRYKYDKIKGDQARLLIVAAGEFDHEVNATLKTLNDEQLGTSDYPYEALSYHWGEGDEDHPIVIQQNIGDKVIKSMSDTVMLLTPDGVRAKRLYVKPSLYSALKHLRSPDDFVALWVDALCINQRDEEEKKLQVMKMASIYRKAGRVCIWLGPANPSSYQAISFIKDIIDPEKLKDLVSQRQYLPQWADLFELLKWSWFSRRWVIQELALAQQATVHCGKETIHWDDLKDAIGIFYKYFDHLRLGLHDNKLTGKHVPDLKPLGAKLLVSLSSNIFRRNRDGTYSSTMSLESLVCELAGFDTSDPRDTIISMRNLAKELNPTANAKIQNSTSRMPPKPDYTLDLYSVYRDFLSWVFQSTLSLDILCRHWALPERSSRGPTTPRLVTLPSWILTVDHGTYGRGEDVWKGRKAGESFVGLPGKGCYNASPLRPHEAVFGTGKGHQVQNESLAEIQPVPGFTSEGEFYDMSLTVSGLLIGVVKWASDPIPDGVIPRGCLERFGWDELQDETLKVPDQLWRTLVADRGPDGQDVPPYYHRACLSCLLRHSPNGHINTKELLEVNDFGDQESPSQEYLRRVQAVTWNRVCLEAEPPQQATTGTHGISDKLVGLGPPKTRVKDLIAILYGCSVPVILRPRPHIGNTEPSYEFIGEAYVYGKMDGEAESDAHVEQKFRLL